MGELKLGHQPDPLEAISSRLRELQAKVDQLVERARSDESEMLDSKEIARVLGQKVRQIYRWADEGYLGIPIVKRDGRYFASRTKLLEWIDAATEPAPIGRRRRRK